MKYLKKYDMFLEDGDGGGVASVNASTTAGMGSVVAAQPGCLPGTTGTTGSGDVGFVLGSKKKKKDEEGDPSEVSDAQKLKKAKLNKVKQ